jgi:valyl-tRNA synthetase
MFKILEKFLRTLHPFMPFITEEIWHKLPHEESSIMVCAWPHIQEQVIDKRFEKEMESLFGVIKLMRNLRSQIEIRPEQKIPASIFPHTKNHSKLIQENIGLIVNLARLDSLKVLDTNKRPPAVISDTIEGVDIYLHFSGLIDIVQEREKIKAKADKLIGLIKVKKERLKNPEFLKKAPAEITEMEKQGIAKGKDTLQRLLKMHDELR